MVLHARAYNRHHQRFQGEIRGDVIQAGNPSDELKLARTAAEAGWHVSRYNVAVQASDSKAMIVYNTYRRTRAEYSPMELYAMGALDELAEATHRNARAR